MRIGIDVGGTSTDAVLMGGDGIHATAKTATTPDIVSGIRAVLGRLREARRFSPDAIDAVVVGTTHFTNAVASGTGLAHTAVVRLGLPATSAVPPLLDWPEHLVRDIGGHSFLCRGGNEFDGRPIAEIDERELRRVAAEIRARGVRSVAVCAVFSSPYAECERRAAEILTREAPSVQVSLSHDIGGLGLLGRENATVVDACLRDLVDRFADALPLAVGDAGLPVPVFLTRNDGTITDVEYVRRHPVAAFGSGPANSLRGAAYLSRYGDCLAVDIGGTTTDVGVLDGGAVRPAAGDITVAGIRTGIRMPQLASAEVGGGSIVAVDGGRIAVGPHSVGYDIGRRARVFGGDTLTASDLAVAAGIADMGASQLVADLDASLVRGGLDTFAATVLGVVSRQRPSPEPVPIVAVGGGSSLVGERLAELGVLQRPRHYEVAGAVGAATAPVAGEVDRVFAVPPGVHEEAVDLATAAAETRVIAAGAHPDTVTVADVHESPLSYPPGHTIRVRVRATGAPAPPPRQVPAGDSGGPG